MTLTDNQLKDIIFGALEAMKMTEKYYKVLNPDRKCIYGEGHWSEPGEWLEVKGGLIPCENGLHLCRRDDLVDWLGTEIWEAEYEGDRINFDNKIVVRKARLVRKLDTWTDRTARLFACDCAEHVLYLFEKEFPDDDRPRKAIETARLYANGEASGDQLAAARDAAWAVAWDAARAARDAAGAAEHQWQTQRLFEYLEGE